VAPVVLANNTYEVSNLTRVKGGLGALYGAAASQARDLGRRDHLRESHLVRDSRDYEFASFS
jgi:hypothetical protein